MTREVILFIQDVVLFILYSQFYFNRHFNKTTDYRPCHFYSGPTKSCVLHGFNYYYKSNCICSGLITAYIFESPLSSTLFSFTFFSLSVNTWSLLRSQNSWQQKKLTQFPHKHVDPPITRVLSQSQVITSSSLSPAVCPVQLSMKGDSSFLSLYKQKIQDLITAVFFCFFFMLQLSNYGFFFSSHYNW